MLASVFCSTLLALATNAPSVDAAYSLTKAYVGGSFFDDWTFAGVNDNTTNGNVDYVNRTASGDLAYINKAGNAIIKVDNVTQITEGNRRSVKIESNEKFESGSLFVLDMLHTPYGCSVWGAAWLTASNWPVGGEVDIFEGVNDQTTNQTRLTETSYSEAYFEIKSVRVYNDPDQAAPRISNDSWKKAIGATPDFSGGGSLRNISPFTAGLFAFALSGAVLLAHF
ncbi:hypothetical protein JCM10908_002501 [Rhodotorula pacifica]|uniref:uncharacterized protein n=1 Tax=Rhodotorula pacifica TaxID=1495444 RepID=UPI0031709DD3